MKYPSPQPCPLTRTLVRAAICLACFLSALASLSGCVRAEHPDDSVYAPAEEGRLLIYTSLREELYAPLIKEFEERTGIWVQVEAGSTVDLAGQIDAGADAPPCDLILSDSCESLQALIGLFSPYTGEVPGGLSGFAPTDRQWTPFALSPLVLIYNTKLVRANPPDGWDSLLSPAWRGKIAFTDPGTDGSGYTALNLLTQLFPDSRGELLSSFADNLGGRIYRDSSQSVQEVADGNCYIGVAPEESALRGIEHGGDLALVYPKEGTCLIPGGLAIVSGCAHEENARLFVRFVLENDAQSYLSDSCYFRAGSGDLSREDPKREFTPFPYDMTAAAENLREVLALWQSLNGEVNP